MADGTPTPPRDRRGALITCAVEVIAENGVAGASVREVARRAGVTHAAAAYHFGDRAGLLAAVAAEGHELLGRALTAARRDHDSFLEVGVAYVRFALDHPAHLEVMYRPEHLDRDHPALRSAKAQTAAILYGTADADHDQLVAGAAAWSIVHGFVTLWRTGNLPPALGDDPIEIARAVAAHLRPPSR